MISGEDVDKGLGVWRSVCWHERWGGEDKGWVVAVLERKSVGFFREECLGMMVR